MHGDDDVAIFWDYENCHTAAHISGYEIVKKIQKIAHNYGSIKLFKAYLELSEPVAYSKSLNLRSELQLSGVSLTDTPHNGRKEVADKMILVDMLAYAIDNPQPATIILISGDRDFAYAVSILRSRRYRVVIISPGGVHISLRAQASVFLDWNTDVLGTEASEQALPLDINRKDLRDISAPPRSQLMQSNTALPNTPSHSRYVSGESDLGIRHARSSSLHLQSINIQKTRYIGREAPLEDTSAEIVAPSYRSRSNTQDSIYTGESGTPIFRAPSKTESAPAAMTFLSRPTSPNVTPEMNHPLANVIKLSPKASTSGSTKLAPEAANTTQDIRNDDPAPGQHASHSIIPDGSRPAPSVSPNGIVARFTEPQAIPTPTAPGSVMHAPSQASASSIPIVTKEPKVVPPIFKLLAQRLRLHRSKGIHRPFRSTVAVELATQDNMLYRRAGTERFGQYVALAEKAGIIELGGKEGGAWIGLCPDWYDAEINPL